MARLAVHYVGRMQYRAWRVKPGYVLFANHRKPAWIGVWFRFGWRYLNIGLKFKEAGRG